MTRALVLSGGGNFGAYQAGAWLALREAGWQPDLVVGASIGALNGFALTRSQRPEELIRLWQELPQEMGAGDRRGCWLPTHSPSAVLRCCVGEIVRRYQDQPRYGELQITITEWPSCAIRVVSDPDITASYLLASCALPAVIPPLRVDGKYYVDGGLFCRLPLRQALWAGATDIVAVDVIAEHPLPALRTLVRAVTRFRNALRRELTDPQPGELRGVRLRRIAPPRTLGSLQQCLGWDRSLVDSLIESGYRDTRSQIAV